MTSIVSTLIFLVAFAATVHGYRVKDHRCRYIETKVDNCTRAVYTPCPNQNKASTPPTTKPYDDSSSEEDSDENDDYDNFVSQIMRRFFRNGNSYSSIQWCRRDETFKCVKYRCYIGCCPNWKYDSTTRKCSIWTGDTPAIDCQNGGSMVRGGNGKAKCRCPASFTGSRCEEATCSPDCLNGGMCDVVGGVSKCICPDDFSGAHCETPICGGGCGTNGYCEARGGQATCVCNPNYTGKSCETRVTPPPEKPGDCPPMTTGSCVHQCREDNHCYGTQKCCSNGCGLICSYPANYTCPFAGRSYKIGETFLPEPCHVCTCLKPDPSKSFGGAQCRATMCPPLNNCKDVRKRVYACCEYCADPVGTVTQEPTTLTTVLTSDSGLHTADSVKPPVDYQHPVFTNCPKALVTLTVEEDENKAALPFTLTATDHKKIQLKVTLSRNFFKAGLNEENFDTVTATSSRDYRGNFVTCTFRVRIRDIHPPTFPNCPADVLLDREGPGNWEEPRAEDNVGLFVEPRSRHKPTDHFSKGEHPVVYTAEDYEGNIAYCRFFVKVEGTDEVSLEEHRGDEDQDRGVLHGNNKWYLLAGMLLLVLVIIIVVLVACICCRRRGRGDAGAATVAPPAYDNAVYTMPLPVPPPYKEKPPLYAEPTEDKSLHPYAELKAPVVKGPVDANDVDVKAGIDNPSYEL